MITAYIGKNISNNILSYNIKKKYMSSFEIQIFKLWASIKRKSIIQIERNESYSIKIYITEKVSLENTLKSAEIILLHSRTFVTAM